MHKLTFWAKGAVLVGSLLAGCASQPHERQLAADETIQTTQQWKVEGNGVGNSYTRQVEVAEIVKKPAHTVAAAPVAQPVSQPAVTTSQPAAVSFSYPTGYARVPAVQAQRLAPVAQWLKENPDQKVTVDGYADAPGEARFNQRLSKNRAAHLRNELIRLGAQPNQVAAVGHGEDPGIERKATVTP